MKQRDQRSLVPVLPDVRQAVLIQGSSAPALRGTDQEGFDYICGVCGATIVERTTEGQIWDLVFRCSSCSTLNESPHLPRGRALPPGTVITPPGQYLIKSTVQQRPETVIAGPRAVEQHQEETGQENATSLYLPAASSVSNAQSLEAYVDRTKVLLGPMFEELEAEHRRGQSASRTPPRNPHRLMELVASVRRSAKTLAGGRPEIDIASLAELQMLLELLERWRNNPQWSKILHSFKNPTDFPHALITLATATFLTHAGNGVELHAEESDNRSPDIQIATTSRGHMSVEVKAPLALQRRSRSLDGSEARRIMEKALKSAGTGWQGQLSANQSALLLVGGFHLQKSDLNVLEREARGLLSRGIGRREHVAGIAVLSVGVLVSTVRFEAGRVESTAGTTVNAIIAVRLTMNPEYAGTVQIDQSERPGLTRISNGSVTEVQLPPA